MAASLWFQARYVEPILAGEKLSTIRARSPLMPGAIVRATVGPRPAFAMLRITQRNVIQLGDILDAEHRAAVERLYPGARDLVELHFAVL